MNGDAFPNHLRTLRLANGIRQIDAALGNPQAETHLVSMSR